MATPWPARRAKHTCIWSTKIVFNVIRGLDGLLGRHIWTSDPIRASCSAPRQFSTQLGGDSAVRIPRSAAQQAASAAAGP